MDLTGGVIYQIYPRSFQDSDGDGIGDLGGVLHRLDHLADLGVDVVWLSPVYPSPQADNGYDISEYQGVDPLFGSLAQLDSLIAALHEPRIWPEYHAGYYGVFFRDPDGNNVEAVHHTPPSS